MATPSQTLDIPPRLPFMLNIESRDYFTNKDARLVNGYTEKALDGSYIVYKRPALTNISQPVGTGIYSYDWITPGLSSGGSTTHNAVFLLTQAAAGDPVLYTFVDGPSYILTGSGPNSTTFHFETMADNNNTLVVYGPMTGGAILWGLTYTSTLTNYTTTINATITTQTIPGIVYLDGTCYVSDIHGNIYGSNVLNLSVWSSLNKFSSISAGDTAVMLSKHLVYVVLLRTFTTEFNYDAGNLSGSPLGAVPGMRLDFGCYSYKSVQNIVGNLVWIAVGRNSTPFVVMLENGRPSRISNPAVERVLSTNHLLVNSSFQCSVGGHNFYGMTVTPNSLAVGGASPVTLVADLKDRQWYVWSALSLGYFPARDGIAVSPLTAGAAVTPSSVTTLCDFRNNYIYSFDPSIYQDSIQFTPPVPIPVDLYTPNFDGGTRRNKHLETMYFDGDRVNSQLSVSTNDADYDPAQWSQPRYVDLNLTRPVLSRCGTFYRRAWHLRHSANTAFRLDGIDLAISIGSL
jgi:hypothetical protein